MIFAVYFSVVVCKSLPFFVLLRLKITIAWGVLRTPALEVPTYFLQMVLMYGRFLNLEHKVPLSSICRNIAHK